MMDKRNLLKLMVLALGVSVLLFVFGYPRGVQPIDEHTIRYVIEQEPSTLDPAKSTTSPEATVQLQLFDGLVRLNDESEPEAALAKNWDISDDGREYTFHLRPNLKWSNGEPLTAYDFEYAWKRVLDPEVHADNAYMLYVLENGEAFNTGKAAAEDVGVKAIDEDTLVVTLENPTAYFLKLLASHSYYLTLVEGGEADMMVEPPVADQKRLEEAGLLHIGPMLGNYYYVFNVKAEPFTDPDVRKAFSMVINRANIVNNIVRGGKEAAYAFVPYGMLESNGREDFREAGSYLVYEDVEQAKEILKKAGYGKNRPLPQITILYNTSELHKSIAEAIQDAWINAFGADVRLQNQETKVFLADREAGKYQVARASWVADYSDPQNFLEVFSAEDNDGQYHSDAYNELIARIRTTPNGAARDALMHEAEKMIFDESLVMPLYFTTQPYVTNGTIQNYFWTTLGLVDFKKAYK
ncbi:MAG: peptide ABC transporter substrate-binding protein [Veillonella sp.]|nr:peptide ABC transporter substrate-binding protein [Veillonella sp.]